MDRKNRFVLLLIPFLLSIGCCAPCLGQEFTTVILVRHAEKQLDGTKDPSLSEEGKRRANRLAYHMNSQPIEMIYSTRFSRNTSTIFPTAHLKGVITKIYEPHQEESFLNEILKKHKGNSVLVCGHSNTVPTMVNMLIGEKRFVDLEDDDYDDIFIVTVTEMGTGTVTIFNY